MASDCWLGWFARRIVDPLAIATTCALAFGGDIADTSPAAARPIVENGLLATDLLVEAVFTSSSLNPFNVLPRPAWLASFGTRMRSNLRQPPPKDAGSLPCIGPETGTTSSQRGSVLELSE
jgi:hypothetical protein